MGAKVVLPLKYMTQIFTIMEEDKSLNFIEQIVENDLQEGKNDGRIQTRFPPEPNGYLHIGHVKAICMDFGIAERYNGVCNLRFDDTNPIKEDTEYVDSIQQDIRWLGFRWGNVYYASDYFDQLYELALRFIREGKAYVDEQTAEQIAEQKGTPTEAGTASPYRDRPVEENLRLFEAMQRGEKYALPRPDYVPHHHDPSAPPDRAQMERISDVRLCPRTERLL